MRVGIKWQYFYLIEVWSLCPASSTQQIQRQNCLKEPWADIWKTCEKQFPAEPIFVKHHVAWLVWAFLAESEAWGAQPQSQTPRCEKTYSRWERLLIGWVRTRVWAQNVRHILAGIIITDSNCIRSTEEMPRGKAELSTDLNYIWMPGRKRKKCFPCKNIWKCCFNSFNTCCSAHVLMLLLSAFLFQISISTFFLSLYLQLPIMLVKKSIFIGTICAWKGKASLLPYH